MKTNKKRSGWFCVLSVGMMVGVSLGQQPAPLPTPAEGDTITFTTKQGRKYEGVTIKKIGKASILIRHDAGLARITYADLPDKLTRIFGIDKKTAEIAAEEMRRNDAKRRAMGVARSRRAEAEQAARNKEWEDKQAADKERAKAKWIHYKVSQVVSSQSAVLARKYSSRNRINTGYGETVFLVLPSTNGIIDGSLIEVLVVLDGTHSYETVLNATATVAKMKAFELKLVD